ncbi:MAG TPA: class I SAM-dependent methyltransferase [Longimicrobiales bacterium]
MAQGFDKIGLTARLTAYMRQFSDIPFAADVARRLGAEQTFERLLADAQLRPRDLLWYAPIFEVRYKSIGEAIRKSGATQVLELASGLSLRGLAMTRDPAVTYVESDLEELTEVKRSLVAELRREYGLPSHGNLHLVTANALDRDRLQLAVEPFRRDRPIAVVHEGLLQYLSRDEMEAVARNIRELLAGFGGVWITPDFSLKADVENVSEQQRRFRAVIARATERVMYDNAFAGDEQLFALLESLGLEARVLNQVDETPAVTSLDALDLPRRILDDVKPRLRLWVSTVRGRH